MSALDDVKDSKEADNNAVKTMALDHLGVIAARIRANQLKVQNGSQKSKLKPVDEVTMNATLNACVNSNYIR